MDCEYPFDMNLIHELENNGSLRKYKRDTHRNMGVSFFVILSVGQKQGDYMKNRFEIQGNCLTVHLPREVDHPAADEIRRESDNILRKNYIRTMVFDFSETMFMDSSGIGMIMGRYRAMGMRGNCIRVTGVSVYIEKLLHLSGVYKFVEICREA